MATRGRNVKRPRCTLLLGLLAAKIIARQPESTNNTTFTSGMRSTSVQDLQLHYTRNVSEAEAERVATWLMREDLPAQFPGPMLFDHTDTSARLDVTAEYAALRDPAMAQGIRLFAAGLSEELLKGTPVWVCLRDASGKVVLTIAPDEESPYFFN